MINKQYNYLENTLNINGQLLDKKLNAPLNFQYHYSSFILSSVLINKRKNTNETLEYYLSIDKNTMSPSNDFNVVLLSFSLLYDRYNLLDKYKLDILKSFYHHTNEELFKLNNNFRALRLVGMILENKLKNTEFSSIIQEEIEWILTLQFDDGFFPDSNMKYEVNKNQGVPHLTYHTKIMMCVGIAYMYIGDNRLKKSFEKAMTVLLSISIENYYFFYGRSTNALFGYASLYISLILAYKFFENKIYLNEANSILSFLENYQHSDGHISINLNRNDNNRPAFDGYMYDIVYNSYSNALFLLGRNILKNIDEVTINNDSVSQSEKVSIFKNSGFVVYKDKNIKYCLNYKGHQNSLKHIFDSRVSSCSFLYYKYNGNNLLPAIGYQPQSVLSKVEKKFIFRKFYTKLYKLYYYDWFPLYGGNSFFYTRNNIKYYLYECIRSIRLGDKIILKFNARSRKLFSNTIYYDKVVISINLSKVIDFNIFFYKEVDNLYFTYRDSMESDNFQYTFNQEVKILKPLKIETSYNYAKLFRYKFKSLKNLAVRIETNV